jgi:ABC-2 type transport system permease protein
MRNTWLILQREYLARVRTRSFLVLTLLLPAIAGGAFVVPIKIATMKSGRRIPHLVVVTSSQRLGELVRTELLSKDETPEDDDEGRASKDSTQSSDRYVIDVDTHPTDSERVALRRKVSSGAIDGYIWMTDEGIADRKAIYSSGNATDFMDKYSLGRVLTRALAEQQLEKGGSKSDEIAQLFKPVKLETVRVENGEESQSGSGKFFLIFGMVMLLYMAVLFYGISVMRSVLEEKNTRILEVLLSSATSTQLMTGKLLGVGAVGLTQMIIWMVMAGTLALPSLAMYPSLSGINMSPFALTAFVAFFLLGYLLYSTIWAGIGAAVSTEQEGQQLQFVIVLPLVIAVFMMMPILRAPDSPIAVWTSMIPFLSPLLMFARIAVQTPPAWQIALSLALLIGTIAGLLLLCARIYRVGVLMYGKRPTLPEIVKWLKYAKT